MASSSPAKRSRLNCSFAAASNLAYSRYPVTTGKDALCASFASSGNALRSAVVCFYLSNEGVSMLENAAHLGLPIPEKLKSILAQLHNRDDKTETTEGDGN